MWLAVKTSINHEGLKAGLSFYLFIMYHLPSSITTVEIHTGLPEFGFSA